MSTVETTTLTDRASAAQAPMLDAVKGSARAWVNFDGTGTVSIRDDYNVDSITDNGTGDYTVNLTTPFSTANWLATCSVGVNSASVAANETIRSQLAGEIRHYVLNDSNSASDAIIFHLSAFGDAP